MKKSVVFMFSGQGSQYYDMGRELYEQHARFRLWMDHCNEMVAPLIQTSLINIIYGQGGDKNQPFDRVLHTNPALICIEYSLSRLLMEMNIKPDYLLGYSLGEISASIVAGSVSLEDGLKFAVEYGAILESGTLPAAMLGVLESERIVHEYADTFASCWITGRNFDKNFVVSGLSDNIKRVQAVLSERNIIYQKLPVNYGFHTELMEPIKTDFRMLADRISFSTPDVPVISGLKAETISQFDEDYLWEVTRYPVNFKEAIRAILTREDCIFIDVGPSGSLATFVKYLLPAESESRHFEVINQFGRNLLSLEKLRNGMAFLH